MNAVSGVDNVGVYRGGSFYLKDATAFGYGLTGDSPIAGDWDGDGVDTGGVFRDGSFYLKDGPSFSYGLTGDKPVAGNWTGDRTTEVGVFRDGMFFLRDSTTGGTYAYFAFGQASDSPIAGDWNGDGITEVGVFRNGVFYLRDSTGGTYSAFGWGLTGDSPIAGDWDGDGKTEVGVFRNGSFYLRSSTGGTYSVFGYGLTGDVPVAGKWNLTSKNEQIQTFAESIRKIQQTGTIPIIDVEFHYGEMDLGKIVDNMDRNGVALTWLSPSEKEGSEESLRLNKLYPDKFVPTTVQGTGPLWFSNDTNFLDKLDGEVRSGNYFTMGEFEARHYPSNTNNRDVHMPLDSKAFEIVFQASSDTGVPFLIHHEAEDAMLPELERMLTKYPNAKVIWCHFGRNRNYTTWSKFMTPDAPREFLNKYPNLYFDFVQSPPGSKYKGGYVEGIMYDTTQSTPTLKPEWKKVIEEFPDRFVLGSDVNWGRFEDYDGVMNRFRQVMISGMPKDIAEKIAYKNAWKLMTGEDWKD